jgi:predicted transcriptional regulator
VNCEHEHKNRGEGVEESAMEAVRAWERAEQGMAPEEPIDRLYLQSLETLLSVLTTRRLELLRALHESGLSSVRALAKELNRDYKNVRQDITLLEKVGLVQRKDGKVNAPWERIIAEIRLAA